MATAAVGAAGDGRRDVEKTADAGVTRAADRSRGGAGGPRKKKTGTCSPAKKRPASDSGDAAVVFAGGEGSPGEEPRKFVSCNANSLLLRMKSDWPAFTQFVSRLDPDVVCVQEVRMPAAGFKGAPKNPTELKDGTSSSREEKQVVLRALSSSPYKDYRVWWSLSDSIYAGTAVFIK